MPEHPRLEAEANYFALCLLMPESRFLEEAQRLPWDLGGDDDSVKALAKMFEVSNNAVAVRLCHLQFFKPLKQDR